MGSKFFENPNLRGGIGFITLLIGGIIIFQIWRFEEKFDRFWETWEIEYFNRYDPSLIGNGHATTTGNFNLKGIVTYSPECYLAEFLPSKTSLYPFLEEKFNISLPDSLLENEGTGVVEFKLFKDGVEAGIIEPVITINETYEGDAQRVQSSVAEINSDHFKPVTNISGKKTANFLLSGQFLAQENSQYHVVFYLHADENENHDDHGDTDCDNHPEGSFLRFDCLDKLSTHAAEHVIVREISLCK